MTEKDYKNKWYLDNKIKILEKRKLYIKENRDKIVQYQLEDHKKYPEKRLFRSIKNRCENLNCKDYKHYGLRNIKCQITKEEIRRLMEIYHYWDLINPTIDRIDNDENYTFDNCRFIENEENAVKDKRKPIFQFDLNDNFIMKWESQQEAHRVLKIAQGDIWSCANNKPKHKSAGGFIWKYNY
jgi:hypothetical protein